MDFNTTRNIILLRVGALTLTIFVFAYSIFHDGFFVTELAIFMLFSLQVIALIKALEKNNEQLSDFLKSLREDDIRLYGTNMVTEELDNAELQQTLEEFLAMKRAKEADFQYLKNIVQHIGIGLITFNRNGEVQIFNTAAKNLLKISQVNNLSDLGTVSEKLVDVFTRLRTGGRELMRLEINGDIVQLAIYAIELTFHGNDSKLISIQNIQNELEEKEMEAWQNLVRVLTHEIMNSVTPISSLANTVEQDLKGQLQHEKEAHTISREELTDIHLAIQTIKKRSAGLIRFVQDFRSLTHVPIAKITEVEVKTIFEEMLVLMRKEIQTRGVETHVNVDPPDLTISADKELIEQVLINLVKNAIQAFDEQTSKLVELKAYIEKNRPVIAVKDNGNGIEDEALEKIFIPFFTTKPNGSGIGLSLSRQIMRQHKGVLGVKSRIDEGTEFFLRF